MGDDEFSVPLYQYKDLDEAAHEIRIAHVLPGAFEDVIRISITHVPLKPGSLQRGLGEQAMSKVRGTLPDGWSVGQTFTDRLLYWKPSSSTDRITSYEHPDPECTITFDSLAQEDPGLEDNHLDVDYEALSYVWGSGNDPETILIVEQDSSTRRLAVTPSLFQALKYLRLQDRQRTLWIDAICIDQQNIAERSRQVRRMVQIFLRARAVVAFLGTESDSDAMAFSALEKVDAQVEHTRCQRSFPRPGCTHPNWWTESGEVPLSPEDFAAIGQLGRERHWFQRVWTLQEIELANSKHSVLQCGHKVISWSAFRHSISTLAYKSQLSPDNAWHINNLHILCQETEHLSFDVIMDYTSKLRRCTNPKDLVYGALSLAPEKVAANVKVDYTNPLADIFKSLIISFFKFENRCNMLRYCGSASSPSGEFQTGDWPSWVPKWSAQPQTVVRHTAAYHAAGPSQVEAWVWGHKQDRLVLNGLFLGSVPEGQGCLKHFESLDDSITYLRYVRRALEERFPEQSQKEILRGRIDDYIMAICRGLVRSRMPHLGYPTLEDWRAIISEPSANETPDHGSPSSLPPRYRALINGFQHSSNGYRLFGINDLRLGVASVPVHSDDQVFLPLGCQSPLLVRRCPEKDGFQVMGEVYMQGVMDGEALLGKLPPGWVVQVQHKEPGRFSTHYNDVPGGLTWSGWNADPRLKAIELPPDWEGVNYTWSILDPQAGAKFRHKKTGEIINYDPRMEGEALKSRGVNIEKITLV